MPEVIYRESAADISPAQLHGFFVGWPNPPSPETHLRLLQHSDAVVVALDAATEHVVGFITAISDHVLAAYIPHLEVLPDYQGRGIGTELVRRMVARLRGHYMIDLICDEDVRPFYERLGFRPVRGMVLRHYDRQSGADDPLVMGHP